MEQKSDLIVLSEKYKIYLKETNNLLIKIHVPPLKNQSNKVISNWEILEKIHSMIKPYIFIQLKVISNSIEEIDIEAEVQTHEDSLKIVKLLENKRIKISGFSDYFTLSSSVSLSEHPNKNDWNGFYHNSRQSDKPGERPDTVHLKGLPTLWFSDKAINKPSQSILESVFNKFGKIRAIYIPIMNPLYRDCSGAFGSVVNMNNSTVDTVTTLLTFEAYIQYKHVSDFSNAILNLRNRKLVFKDVKIDSFGLPMDSWFNAEIVVDFDREMHLSESSVSKREVAVKEYYRRLMEEADKTKREEEAVIERIKRHELKRRKCEEDRKRRAEAEAAQRELAESQRRLADDQRSLLIAQRNVESIRLLSALLDAIKGKEEAELLRTREIELEVARQKLLAEERARLEQRAAESARKQQRRREDLLGRELELRASLMRRLDRHDDHARARKHPRR